MREKACMVNGKKGVGEEEEEGALRRGPWTFEEDTQLIDYIDHHGYGQWNTLAKSSGLKRTGKSCRLRWLNYLKPDVKRGNLTPQEQLLILHLHSIWGNRWSKIAQHLPGRTDNEIKNYWRTRVHKHARQLRIESNSNDIFDTIRHLWTPRLFPKMDQTSSSIFTSPSSPAHFSTPCPPLSSSSPGFMINSTSHPGENPYSEASESTNFSSDYSKIAILLQNQDYPSSFLQNDMNLKNSTMNGTCFVENHDNRYDDMWDFYPSSSSSAPEMYEISEIESHLAGSNWEMADTLWNI